MTEIEIRREILLEMADRNYTLSDFLEEENLNDSFVMNEYAVKFHSTDGLEEYVRNLIIG